MRRRCLQEFHLRLKPPPRPVSRQAHAPGGDHAGGATFAFHRKATQHVAAGRRQCFYNLPPSISTREHRERTRPLYIGVQGTALLYYYSGQSHSSQIAQGWRQGCRILRAFGRLGESGQPSARACRLRGERTERLDPGRRRAGCGQPGRPRRPRLGRRPVALRPDQGRHAGRMALECGQAFADGVGSLTSWRNCMPGWWRLERRRLPPPSFSSGRKTWPTPWGCRPSSPPAACVNWPTNRPSRTIRIRSSFMIFDRLSQLGDFRADYLHLNL